jgi:hypothetical protein
VFRYLTICPKIKTPHISGVFQHCPNFVINLWAVALGRVSMRMQSRAATKITCLKSCYWSKQYKTSEIHLVGHGKLFNSSLAFPNARLTVPSFLNF